MHYVCQVPHLHPATVWTASSEQEIIAVIVGDTDLEFASAVAAAEYDMRDAYVTTDAFDLYLWINSARAPIEANARRAFFDNRDAQREVERIATEIGEDDTIYNRV